MKILLHTCCAPCLIYPLERLQEKGYAVKAFYYNPNIHPFSEYSRRKDALEALSKELGVEAGFPQYRPSEFFQAVNTREERPERCGLCWSLRLARTARQAKEEGFDAFTSTLLVSPYQDQAMLKESGEKAAKEAGVGFYYEDFRPGFKKAHEQARAKGIYCQRYCGCIYSEIERDNKKKK